MVTTPQPDPDGQLFDDVYASMRGADPASVPWAHGKPHPMFASWLAGAKPPRGDRTRALIVGSGLGDDAEAVAALGWNVTAFDVSSHAIAWARERFPESKVSYRIEDVFALPEEWHRAFDLVVEIHTVQALPVTRRQATVAAIADTVAPGGELVVVAITRDVHVPLRGRPWPLTSAELASFERYGLREDQRLTEQPESADHPGRVRVSFIRPE